MNDKKLAIIALGGNSIARGSNVPYETQSQYVAETCQHIVKLCNSYNIGILHGNGPQVGDFLEMSAAAAEVPYNKPQIPMPLAGGATQGVIGTQIYIELANQARLAGQTISGIVPVVTPVIVDRHDPAFQNPTKPVGPWYTSDAATKLYGQYGWVMKNVRPDKEAGWRRVVPSPEPIAIHNGEAIRSLIATGYIPIAVGGGGVPTYIADDGSLVPVAAVIDKDRAGALWASSLEADLFIISTDVDKAYLNYQKPDQKAISLMTLSAALQHLDEGQFGEGSMKPKVQAAIRFVSANPRGCAIITSPENITLSLENKVNAGTWIIADNIETSI